MLPGLFQSVLGEENFRRTVFDRLVPSGTFYITRVKKVPTFEQVKELLKISNPQYRAIIGMLACTGMRIRELLSRKVLDVEERSNGYGRIRLLAKETKARYQRTCFVTKEVMCWIRDYRTWLGTNSEYVFPGDVKGWLQYDTVLDQIKRLYRKIGLKDASDKSEIYCIHSFRTFADNQMRKAGLDSKYCSAIIGHTNKLQSEISYIDWDIVEKEWLQKVEPRMTFLDTRNQVEPLQKKNSILETLLELSDSERSKLFSLLKKQD